MRGPEITWNRKVPSIYLSIYLSHNLRGLHAEVSELVKENRKRFYAPPNFCMMFGSGCAMV
jgi:hypothetical protein